MACDPRMGNPEVAERLVPGERTVCEVGAVAITEGDRTSGAAPPSFRADRRLGVTNACASASARHAQVILFWSVIFQRHGADGCAR
jgi:hypothetical protein